MSWRDAAACRDSDSDTFFNPALQERAKSICAECPVSLQCLLYAQGNRMTYGVWGGRTAKQRQKPKINGDGGGATVATNFLSPCPSPLSGG